MSERQRAQVVELLRCAADLYIAGIGGIGRATDYLFGDNIDARYGNVWSNACNAWDATVITMPYGGATYADVCLEAAQRVEEGSWPVSWPVRVRR